MHLFAYGTLMSPEIMARVTGVKGRSKKATLSGYVRRKIRGEVYPAITLQAGGFVDGLIYYDLTAAAFDRLDRFEGSLYARTQVAVACEDGQNATAQTYVITAGWTHRLCQGDWSYEEFQQKQKQLFLSSYRAYDHLD